MLNLTQENETPATKSERKWSMYALAHPILALVSITSSLLTLYTWVIIISALITWVNPDPYNPIIRILRALTEPAFNAVRPYVPTVGAVDLAPVAVILGILFIQQGILPIIAQFAHGLL